MTGRTPAGRLRPDLPLPVRLGGGEAPLASISHVGGTRGGPSSSTPGDMFMIDHVPELMDAGLDSLKSRAGPKAPTTPPLSPRPTATPSTPPGRGSPLDPAWRDEVDKVSHRPTHRLLLRRSGQHTAHARYLRDWQVVGWSPPCAPRRRRALCELRNKFAAGRWLELVGPACALSPSGWEGPDRRGRPAHPGGPKPQMPFRLRLPVQALPLSLLRRKAVGL